MEEIEAGRLTEARIEAAIFRYEAMLAKLELEGTIKPVVSKPTDAKE